MPQLVGNTTERIAEELRVKNAMEQIPLLEFTDPHSGETQSLTQSLAIIEYLEEAFPASHRVLPTCALRRARARQVRSLICCVYLCHRSTTHLPIIIQYRYRVRLTTCAFFMSRLRRS